MGFFREDGPPGHEGHAVGFVPRDGYSKGSGILRELGYPDRETRQVEMIAAACECGWRSPHFRPEQPTEYGPFSVFCTERDDEVVFQLWDLHMKSLPDLAAIRKKAAAVVFEAQIKRDILERSTARNTRSPGGTPPSAGACVSISRPDRG